MYFLHTDAREAARSLCVQDLLPVLRLAVHALKYAHGKRHASKSPLLRWVIRSADNYQWLAYFAQMLGIRISQQKAFVSKHHSSIYLLRVCVPTRLVRYGRVDEFPNLLKERQPNAITLVAAYRLAYVNKRRYNAKWGQVKAPGWFSRLVYTVHDQRRGSSVTLRNFASGLSRSNHPGRSVAEW